jgi:hypothetical protein
VISTVGDIRKALEGLPDQTPVDLDIRCGYWIVTGIDAIQVIRSRKDLAVCVMFKIDKYCEAGVGEDS